MLVFVITPEVIKDFGIGHNVSGPFNRLWRFLSGCVNMVPFVNYP